MFGTTSKYSFGIIIVTWHLNIKSCIMKLTLLSSTLFIALGVNAQITFNTGDVDFDADLNIINTSAKNDLSLFKTDLTATFGVSTKNIDYMFSINMEPGEIYLALEISASVNRPIEVVIETYEAHRDKGWGYIAQQLGIKPGSEAFHALKGKSKSHKDKVSKSTGNSGKKSNSAVSKKK